MLTIWRNIAWLRLVILGQSGGSGGTGRGRVLGITWRMPRFAVFIRRNNLEDCEIYFHQMCDWSILRLSWTSPSGYRKIERSRPRHLLHDYLYVSLWSIWMVMAFEMETGTIYYGMISLRDEWMMFGKCTIPSFPWVPVSVETPLPKLSSSGVSSPRVDRGFETSPTVGCLWTLS